MKFTRNEIETMGYRMLQGVGRLYEKDGHNLKLNAKRDELRAEILLVYDAYYSPGEPEPKPKRVTPEPEEIIEEPSPEPNAAVAPDTESKLYVARNASYRDWESGFTLSIDDKPKPLPEHLTEGIRNAIAQKRIVPFEG